MYPQIEFARRSTNEISRIFYANRTYCDSGTRMSRLARVARTTSTSVYYVFSEKRMVAAEKGAVCLNRDDIMSDVFECGAVEKKRRL